MMNASHNLKLIINRLKQRSKLSVRRCVCVYNFGVLDVKSSTMRSSGGFPGFLLTWEAVWCFFN